LWYSEYCSIINQRGDELSQDARIRSRLLRQVQSRNGELQIEAAIEAGLGILFTALTAGVVFCLAWFVCFLSGARRVPAINISLLVTGIFVLVGTISAWRHVDPFAGLKPMSEAQHSMIDLSHAVDGYVHINRHSVAGIATLVMSGPVNLVSALRTWRHRLPTDPELLDKATQILAACRPEVDLKKFGKCMPAALLLRRLTLIVPRDDSTIIRLTEKGNDLCSGIKPE
jgi:hypothetical protein